MSVQNSLFSDTYSSSDSVPCYFNGSVANNSNQLVVTQIFSGQIKVGMAVCRGLAGCNNAYILPTNFVVGGGIGTYTLSVNVTPAVPALVGGLSYTAMNDSNCGVFNSTLAVAAATVVVPNQNCTSKSFVLLVAAGPGGGWPGGVPVAVSQCSEGSFVAQTTGANFGASVYLYLIINPVSLGLLA